MRACVSLQTFIHPSHQQTRQSSVNTERQLKTRTEHAPSMQRAQERQLRAFAELQLTSRAPPVRQPSAPRTPSANWAYVEHNIWYAGRGAHTERAQQSAIFEQWHTPSKLQSKDAYSLRPTNRAPTERVHYSKTRSINERTRRAYGKRVSMYRCQNRTPTGETARGR